MPAIQLYNQQNLNGWYARMENNPPAGQQWSTAIDPDDGTTRCIHYAGNGFGVLAKNGYINATNYRLLIEWKWAHNSGEPIRYGTRLGKNPNGSILMHYGGQLLAWLGRAPRSLEVQTMYSSEGDIIALGTLHSWDGEYETVSQGQAPSWNYRGGYRWLDGSATTRTFQSVDDSDLAHFHALGWTGQDDNWPAVGGPNANPNPAAVGVGVNGWNAYEITASNTTVEVRLNGTLVNQITNVNPSQGKIALHGENSAFYVRRVEYEDLITVDPNDPPGPFEIEHTPNQQLVVPYHEGFQASIEEINRRVRVSYVAIEEAP